MITRHISSLRVVYNFYGRLGFQHSPDNTFTMTRMQFWRLLMDCGLHKLDIMLTDIDRFIGKS